MQKKLWALAVALSALAVTAGCSTQTQTAEESEVVADNGRGCLIIVADHPYSFKDCGLTKPHRHWLTPRAALLPLKTVRSMPRRFPRLKAA